MTYRRGERLRYACVIFKNIRFCLSLCCFSPVARDMMAECWANVTYIKHSLDEHNVFTGFIRPQYTDVMCWDGCIRILLCKSKMQYLLTCKVKQ